MKTLLLLTLLSTLLLSRNSDTLQSFSADFNQSIKDDHNKTITYLGTMQSRRPNFARWQYKTPVNKTLYVYDNRVTIIEPDLEQAVIKDIDKNIDIFKMMQRAKKIDATHYEADYNEQKFLLTYDENKTLQSIDYSDELDNRVTITFSHQKKNVELNTTLFKAVIPEDFDIIK
jgi:outer membrane lipoprotein carrier protein